jgi:hypothetical protein
MMMPLINHVRGGDVEEVTAAGFKLIGDLAREPRAAGTAPPDLQERLLAAGYRSFLIVSTSTRFQPLHLTFWSKQPNAFSLQDVTVARHIAGCVGRTTDLSSFLHVALFRSHFMGVFLRRAKAPGCSRIGNHLSSSFPCNRLTFKVIRRRKSRQCFHLPLRWKEPRQNSCRSSRPNQSV